MVGGRFEIGPTSPRTWVIGYRSPRFQWNFRTTDLDCVTSIVNYSQRSLTLTAESRCGMWPIIEYDVSKLMVHCMYVCMYVCTTGRHRLEVTIKSPEGSFGPPIYVPTHSGFSCIPGCRESFTATANVKAYDTSSAKIVLSEEYEIELAALEFGGNLQRGHI